MKNKKLINEEIKRIHELMGVNDLFSDLFINEVLDIVDSRKLLSEQPLARLAMAGHSVSPTFKATRLIDLTTGIAKNTMVNLNNQPLISAELKAAATELNSATNYVAKLEEFSKATEGTPKRALADDLIETFITNVHSENTDLAGLESAFETLRTNEIAAGTEASVVDEKIQTMIDDFFYGPDKKVKFTDDGFAPIYTNRLRKNLNLETDWVRPTEPKATFTPLPDGTTYKGELERIINFGSEESKFQELIKFMEGMVESTKNLPAEERFKIPEWVKGSTDKDGNFTVTKDTQALLTEIKKEYESYINRQLDTLGERYSPDSVEKVNKVQAIVDGMADTERAKILTEATERTKKQYLTRFDSLIKFLKENKLVNAKSKIGQAIRKVVLEIPVVGEKSVKLWDLAFKNWKTRILTMIVIEVINTGLEWSTRRNYDKTLPLPMLFTGIPFIDGTVNELVGWVGKAIFSKYILGYDMIATVTNMIYAGTLGGSENARQSLSGSKQDMISKGVIPEYQNVDDNTAKTMYDFFNKVLTKDQKNAIDTFRGETVFEDENGNQKSYAQAVQQFGNNWISMFQSDLDFLDGMYGLPFNQFYFNGSDVYLVNKNGRFTVKGLDTDEPYIEGKNEDGEIEQIKIKTLFEPNDNTLFIESGQDRYFEHLTPTDEQTKLVIYSPNAPINIINPTGFNNQRLLNSVGVANTNSSVASLEEKADILRKIPGVKPSDLVIYTMYDMDNLIANPEKEGTFILKTKEQNDGEEPKALGSFVYYIDGKGPKDALGYSPAYRLQEGKGTSGYEYGVWYIGKKEDDKSWLNFKEWFEKNDTSTTQSTNENLSPKEQFEKDNNVKLTLTASIGDLAVYKANGKRYKLSEGNIVEF